MKKNRIKYNKIDKNARNVMMPCIGCGKMLKFHVKNENVIEGEGVIAMNFPGAVCHGCIHSVLDRVAEPEGLVCIKKLDPILGSEFLLDFKFLLPYSEAVKFFASLFRDSEMIDEAATKRLQRDEFTLSLN
jgi:hypothetical protein